MTATNTIATRPVTGPQSTSYNPYIEMPMRVMDSALKMEDIAKEVAAIIAQSAGRERTKTEQGRLTSLYNRMDRLEVGLKRCLNP